MMPAKGSDSSAHETSGPAFQFLVHRVPVSEGGGYWAEVPSAPGCATQGETLDELLDNIQDALRGVLDVISESSECMPDRAADSKFFPTANDFEMKIAV
jgi:predicted RNase H-like HicB family nuclease